MVDSTEPLPRERPLQAPALLDFSALAAYEWMSTPAWVYDLQEFRHHWGNAAALRFWRATDLAEFCSRSYADSSDASKARVRLSMQAHARGEVTSERWTLYPAGVPMNIELQGTGIQLPDGRLAVLYLAQDMAAIDPPVLRAIEAMQHTDVLIAVHRMDGEAVLRNTAAQLAFGTLQEAGVGNSFVQMFVNRDMGEAALARVRRGDAVQLDIEMRTLNGSRWCRFRAQPVWDPVTGDRAAQVTASDISSLIQTRLELAEALKAAEGAVDAKNRFLRTMSHELRTPINGMLGMVQLLADTTLDEQQQRWVQTLFRSTQSLHLVVSDVLELARLDAGGTNLQPRSFAPRNELRAALTLLEPEAQRKGLMFECGFDPSLDEPLVADLQRIRQLLFYLVANAIKFTPKGSVRVHFGLVQPEDAGVRLKLTVSDTGIGIAPDQLERIFEPFTQVEADSARRFGGSGLGLTLVRRIVDLMAGDIRVHSAPGMGSSFEIELPVQLAADYSLSRPAPLGR
jgi:signal transduction histidine kinase